MAVEKLFHVGVKALIYDAEGRLLILLANVATHSKNTEPYWDIPGGRIQQGDDILTTLKREILEETGVATTSAAQFVTAVISRHEIPLGGGRLVGLVLMIYKVTIGPASQIAISDEHAAYEWVSPAEAAQRLSNKYPAEFTNSL